LLPFHLAGLALAFALKLDLWLNISEGVKGDGAATKIIPVDCGKAKIRKAKNCREEQSE